MHNPLDVNEADKRWTVRVFTHPITVGAYYLVVISATFIFSQVTGQLDTETLTLIVLGSLTLFIAIFALTAVAFRLSRQQEIEDRIRDLKNFIDAQQIGWIVNDKYIRSIEFGSNDTWVFTRNLVNDLDESGEIFQSVKANLFAGRKYKYFLPDIPTTFEIVARYRRIHTFQDDQVQFYVIPQENFIFYTEVVAYNVEEEEGQTAIEWLPFTKSSDPLSSDDSQFYIQMDAEHTQYIVGIGRLFIEKFSPVSPGT